MTLNEIAKRAHENAVNKGFYEKPLETGTLLMLVIAELGKAFDDDQKGKKMFREWYETDDKIHITDMVKSYEIAIKNTFEDEIADAMIILLGICAHKGIDIDWHIEQKMRYHETREYKHGKAY